MINRKLFFLNLRVQRLFLNLNQAQVDGMNAILDEWERRKLTDSRWLAYMLATAYHETAKTMRAIEEYGKGRGKPYGSKVTHGRKKYALPDEIYYGRGLVQLTWYENYWLMGKLLKIDLLENPWLALHLDIAVKIMFEGMLRAESAVGDFTGKCLENYFSSTRNDPEGARKIINGNDKAKTIAVYYNRFLSSIKLVEV